MKGEKSLREHETAPHSITRVKAGCIQAEINLGFLFSSDVLVQLPILFFLREEEPIQRPKHNYGDVCNDCKFGICLIGGEGKEGANQRDRPAFDDKGIGVHAGDDVLNKFQMFEFFIHKCFQLRLFGRQGI